MHLDNQGIIRSICQWCWRCHTRKADSIVEAVTAASTGACIAGQSRNYRYTPSTHFWRFHRISGFRLFLRAYLWTVFMIDALLYTFPYKSPDVPWLRDQQVSFNVPECLQSVGRFPNRKTMVIIRANGQRFVVSGNSIPTGNGRRQPRAFRH